MIRHQLVQWILLPNGLSASGRLSASVFIAPRLLPSDPANPSLLATLADFPDFTDWPAKLRDLKPMIEGPDGAVEAPISISSSASSALWKALFPSTTPVRAFKFDDFADRPMISYPYNDVLGHLRHLWANIALQGREDLPVTNSNAVPIGPALPLSDREGSLARHFEELGSVTRTGVFQNATGNSSTLSERLRNILNESTKTARDRRQRNFVSPPDDPIAPFQLPSLGSLSSSFYLAAGFHARPSGEEPKPFPASREDAEAELQKVLDFHHHLSLLGEHPALLRALGLVVDIEIRPDFVPTTSDGDPPTRLRLRIERPSGFPPRGDGPGADTWNLDVTPYTGSRLTVLGTQAFFSAAERTDRLDFAHGFLRMDPARYAPVAVDVDGLALKALNMSATLERQELEEKQRPLEEPGRDGIPSARTGGVALIHTGRAEDLRKDFYQARNNNQGLEADPTNPPDVAAEDLVRGYRMDIWSDGIWRSLHSRRIVYVPGRAPEETLAVEDEGSVQISLTAEAPAIGAAADPDRPVYVHEALVTWDGWSLSAPRPGEPIKHEPAVPEADAESGSLRLSIASNARPGTLPRLRFLSRYRTRVRTVDLAGNSHSLPVADLLVQVLEGTGEPRYLSATPVNPLLYLRFEPVPPPELVPRFPFGPGEGLERLVIRSTPGETAESYSAASQGAANPLARFRAFCDRHVAAAKASLQLVETHGLLDQAIDAVRGMDPKVAATAAQPFYDEVASRESGSFREAPGALFVPTGVHQEVPQARGDLDEALRIRREEGYVCLDADTVELPYLPDPLAAGAMARLTFEPGRPVEVLQIPFGDGGGWHRAMPFRLRLEEGRFGAHYRETDRLLTVALPPGRTARLRLSSLFVSDPDIFGITGWCREALDPAKAEQVVDAIKAGTHWMTAPWRDLVLVHAVQRPIEPAQLALTTLREAPGFAGTLVLARTRGDTVAQLEGQLFFDMPSTAQLDVSAIWEEVEDDPARTYPTAAAMVHPARREVFSLPVPEPLGTPWLPELVPLIEPHIEGVVGFRTHGPDDFETPEGVRLRTPEGVRLRLLEAAAITANTPEKRRLEAGAAQLERLRAHEFGDTRYRRVTYRASASTRFREYFDPAMPALDGTSTGEPINVDVLSSAPPAKPTVLQVLPLMGYNQSRADDGAVTSRRRGLGLRVWLARPWFSSGADELLAVVCNRGGHMTPDSELSREITMIVQDPTRASTVPQPLRAGSFRTALPARENVPLNPSGAADIAVFSPAWDDGRQAWYCDLEFDTGAAYFPFVRLGLARYQPHSIPGCELSPIVPTAFMQTVPDRTLNCTLAPGEGAAVVLSGPAPSSFIDAQGTAAAGSNLVAAVVEVQEAHMADPFLGWVPAGLETELACTIGDDGTATWRGTVPLPDAKGRKLRLAVREFELHPADDRSAQPSRSFVTTRRLVHADVIPL